MNKTLEYYLAQPYTIELVPDPDEGWFVVRVSPPTTNNGQLTINN